MEIPQHIFLVQSLKSFHTGTKAKVDARKRFDDANKQPKLPALVGALKAVKDKKQKSKSNPTSTPVSTRKIQAAISIPTKVAARSPEVARQAASIPQQSNKNGVFTSASVRCPPTPSSTRVRLSSRRTDSVKSTIASKETPSPSLLRTRVVQQLPTPPPTPPLDISAPAKVVNQSKAEPARIPRSKGMIFPKSTPIPRSNAMVSKPESKVAPKVVKREVRKAPTSPSTPKTVQNSPAGKPTSPSSKVSRTPIITPQAKLARPITPRSESPIRRVVAKRASPTKIIENRPTTTDVVEQNEEVVEVVPTVAEVVAEASVEKAEAEPQAAQVAVQCQITKVSEPEATFVAEKTKEVQESPSLVSNGVSGNERIIMSSSEPRRPVSPRKASHSSTVTELQMVLEKRRLALNSRKPIQPRREEPSPKKVQTPVTQTAVNSGSGIQARIAAMYASAGTKAPTQPTVVPLGARVCQFKKPELLETDKASKNVRIQREIEALRSMNKVGTGGAAIIKTRAFGGTDAANRGAQETQVGALPLHLRNVVERARRERLGGSTQERNQA